MNSTKAYFTAILLIALLTSGCSSGNKAHRDLSLTVEDYNPPKFIVSGEGAFDVVTVGGPDLERTNPSEPEGRASYWKEYWVIMPKPRSSLMSLNELGPITYGQTPEGYEQWVPRDGAAPPLVEGQTYYVQFRTKEGRAASRLFILSNGKIITLADD